jgi:hypothetical protein
MGAGPMKFFIPGVDGKRQAAEFYDVIKKSAEKMMTSKVSDRQIYSITLLEDGKEVRAKVGKPDPILGETVIAILEAHLYLVCTYNRGVARGRPIFIGKHEVIDVEEFDQ